MFRLNNSPMSADNAICIIDTINTASPQDVDGEIFIYPYKTVLQIGDHTLEINTGDTFLGMAGQVKVLSSMIGLLENTIVDDEDAVSTVFSLFNPEDECSDYVLSYVFERLNGMVEKHPESVLKFEKHQKSSIYSRLIKGSSEISTNILKQLWKYRHLDDDGLLNDVLTPERADCPLTPILRSMNNGRIHLRTACTVIEESDYMVNDVIKLLDDVPEITHSDMLELIKCSLLKSWTSENIEQYKESKYCEDLKSFFKFQVITQGMPEPTHSRIFWGDTVVGLTNVSPVSSVNIDSFFVSALHDSRNNIQFTTQRHRHISVICKL